MKLVILQLFNVVWKADKLIQSIKWLALQFKSHQTFPSDEIRLTKVSRNVMIMTTQEISDPQSSRITARYKSNDY